MISLGSIILIFVVYYAFKSFICAVDIVKISDKIFFARSALDQSVWCIKKIRNGEVFLFFIEYQALDWIKSICLQFEVSPLLFLLHICVVVDNCVHNSTWYGCVMVRHLINSINHFLFPTLLLFFYYFYAMAPEVLGFLLWMPNNLLF